ncbi:MAG: hypothetical protein ACUVSQ_03560 [Pseudanabaenaceae cyanobacterium]
MGFLAKLQQHLRQTPGDRRFPRSPQFDEQLGFGEAEPRQSSIEELLEPPLRAIAVGERDLAGELVFFLDGIQRSWLLYYQAGAPVYFGYGAAVIRQRCDRRLQTWGYQSQEALYMALARLDNRERARLQQSGLTVVDTATTADHPLMQCEAAREAIGRERERLEVNLARQWLQGVASGWLVIDGSLTGAAETAGHRRTVGLIKSHNTQFFPAAEQAQILALTYGERSSAFVPRGRYPVCSWYLRLRDVGDRDPYFGLIRVETAIANLPLADTLSRWLLAEGRPLSLPDSRWDKMIYPIRDCEQYLRSREPSRVQFGWLG